MVSKLLFTCAFLNFLVLLSDVAAFGQVQVLKEYDFNEGGYYLLGQFSESDPSTLRDSLGEFYTNDIVLLNQIKKDWIFSRPGKRYACGYHYRISICKGGEALESFGINLNCKEIVGEMGYYYFDPALLRKLYGKLKKPYRQANSFQDIEEARTYRQKIIHDPRLVLAPSPLWMQFEGSFRFTYTCTKSEKCLDEQDLIFNRIEAEIKRKYPQENFELSNVGGSLTTMELEIACDKSLSDQFALYQRNKEAYFGQWEPFDLHMQTYWIGKP